jgi:hypothetical protein
MFTMMNEARLGVGIQALALSEVAYQNAVLYARERRQGRALTGAKEPDMPADTLLVHPDVRRALATIRGFNIAARALVLAAALEADIAARATLPLSSELAEDRLGLLTPVIKGVLSERAFDNVVAAQQVFGGMGYIAETGMEQLVRDARIAMIYEGANGIQALDLVGRKLPKDRGRAVMSYFKEIGDFIGDNSVGSLAAFAQPLKKGLDDLQTATRWFMANALTNPDNAGAGATDYMHLFGLVALGYMWSRLAGEIDHRARKNDPRSEKLKSDLAIGRIFMQRTMPETALRLARITAGGDGLMSLPADAF